MRPILTLLLLLALTPLQAADCPRIVSQSPYLTHTLSWLGVEGCIVGVSRYDTLERPHTGGVLDPDAEAIALLEPELLVTSNWTPAERLAEVTPPGARALRLDGFASMAQIEENLRTLGAALGQGDIEARVAQFHADWQGAAHALEGKGRRVLLLSSCSGAPYSFGRERWLADLFREAGFVVVEDEPRIRLLDKARAVEQLNALLARLRPELLFIFERTDQPQCAMIRPVVPLRIITLDGTKLLHPAPILLEPLRALAARKHEWGRP